MMAGGWECPTCSTVNDEWRLSCAQCGLTRVSIAMPTASDAPSATAVDDTTAGRAGAEGTGFEPSLAATPTPTTPVESPPGGDDPEIAPAPRPLWRRIPLGTALFVALIIGGGISGWYFAAGRSASGEISKAGDLMARDLRVGDCFDLKEPEAEELEDVTARPCAQEHQYELFFTGSLPEGAYPPESVFEDYFDDNCGPAFATYVGKAYELSELDAFWLIPTAEAWVAGDRSVQCSVHDPVVDRLTTTLRGSNR